jgi:hypothetical protein
MVRFSTTEPWMNHAQDVNIQIFDFHGAMTRDTTIRIADGLNINDLRSGLYLLKARFPNGQVRTARFFKG